MKKIQKSIIKIFQNWKKKKHFKKEMTLAIILIFITSIFLYSHIKKQEHYSACLQDIDYLSSDRYIYKFRSQRKYFKEQDEAIDYCLRTRF